MYVYVVRSDVAVKRVFYGDNNSDINVYIRELILSNKDRNLQILLTDCLSAIKKLKRGEAGGRTKHLDIRAKAVADRMKRELVSLSYVPTEDNVD